MELHYVNQTYRGLLETYHNMNAKRDENRKTTITALLETDGVTIVNVKAIPSSHALCADNGTSGLDNGNNVAIDENHQAIVFAVSSSDGNTPVALYANSNGQLLIQST